MPRDVTILDFSQPAVRELVVEKVKRMRGFCSFLLKRCKEQRSKKQNSMYWTAIVPVVAGGLAEVNGEEWDDDRAHEFMKDRFLSIGIPDKNGEIIGHVVRSTTSLTKSEFSKYVDEISEWALDYLGVKVPRSQQAEQEQP